MKTGISETKFLQSQSASQTYFTTNGQTVCLGVEPTLGLVTRYSYYLLYEGFCLKVAVLSLSGALSDEKTDLQFAVQSLKWSESRGAPNDTLLSHLRLPQPGGPRSRIYIPQEQGGPVIYPGTEFP
jgi:hypothetical protein